jgi:hypothetical protein
MKTISTIVLEESIKAALIKQNTKNISEQGGLKLDPNKRVTTTTDTIKPKIDPKPKPKIDPKPKPDDKLDPKPKPDDKLDPKPKTDDTKKPKPVINTQQLAYDIATEIINSAGWNDDEERLIKAIQRIPNSTVFYRVNELIKTNKQKYFSTFIADEILDTDEWEVWIPILKHLTSILSLKDDRVIRNIMAKTDGIGPLMKKDSALAKKVSTYLPQPKKQEDKKEEKEVREVSKVLGSLFAELGPLGIVALVGVLLVAYRSAPSIGRFILKTYKTATRGTSAIDTPNSAFFEAIDNYFLASGKLSRKRLFQLLDSEVEKGTITKADANALKKLSRVERKQMARALQNTKLSVTIARWMEHPGTIKKGDAERISKYFGPKHGLDKTVKAELKKIEDYYVKTKKAAKADDAVTTTKTNILSREVGTAIRSSWKINTDSIKNWFKIYRSFKPQSIHDVEVFNQLIQKINNYKKNGKNLSTAIIDWSREYDSKPLWYADFTYWINGSKGTRTFPFYLQQSKFPSYEQWAKDMSLAKFDKINQTEYNLQRYYWENTKV